MFQLVVRVSMAVCNYQVFVSFRGPDTRQIFIPHFKEQLREWGITPFLDSDEIEYGDTIDKKIMDAIERSDICIPVFSKDFATSRPCLMEVAQMVKSKKKKFVPFSSTSSLAMFAARREHMKSPSPSTSATIDVPTQSKHGRLL